MLDLNRVGAVCVGVGTVGGLLVWGILSLTLPNDPRISGISSFVGMAVASVVDVLYRVTCHRERGVVRLVHCECGGAYLTIPVWTVGVMLLVAFGNWLFFGR